MLLLSGTSLTNFRMRVFVNVRYLEFKSTKCKSIELGNNEGIGTDFRKTFATLTLDFDARNKKGTFGLKTQVS